MHSALRDSLSRIASDHENIRILYGGSVKPENAGDLLAIANVNGALVGGSQPEHLGFLGYCDRLSIIRHGC